MIKAKVDVTMSQEMPEISGNEKSQGSHSLLDPPEGMQPC